MSLPSIYCHMGGLVVLRFWSVVVLLSLRLIVGPEISPPILYRRVLFIASDVKDRKTVYMNRLCVSFGYSLCLLLLL
jgi:hypothetical protein